MESNTSMFWRWFTFLISCFSAQLSDILFLEFHYQNTLVIDQFTSYNNCLWFSLTFILYKHTLLMPTLLEEVLSFWKSQGLQWAYQVQSKWWHRFSLKHFLRKTNDLLVVKWDEKPKHKSRIQQCKSFFFGDEPIFA